MHCYQVFCWYIHPVVVASEQTWLVAMLTLLHAVLSPAAAAAAAELSLFQLMCNDGSCLSVQRVSSQVLDVCWWLELFQVIVF